MLASRLATRRMGIAPPVVARCGASVLSVDSVISRLSVAVQRPQRAASDQTGCERSELPQIARQLHCIVGQHSDAELIKVPACSVQESCRNERDDKRRYP